jgi:hypothetical protein
VKAPVAPIAQLAKEGSMNDTRVNDTRPESNRKA